MRPITGSWQGLLAALALSGALLAVLAEGAALSALAASTRRPYAVVGLVLVGIALALVVLRRRVHRRDHEATHDPLTGLGNRAHLHRAGGAALRTARARPDGGLVALLLSYLKTLPVRSLKIDRGFVTGLTSSPQDEAVARAVVGLATTWA